MKENNCKHNYKQGAIKGLFVCENCGQRKFESETFMNKYEDAYKKINDNLLNITKYMKLMNELVNKNKPTKPFLISYEEHVGNDWHCPNESCHMEVLPTLIDEENNEYEVNNCPNCGQALLWE